MGGIKIASYPSSCSHHAEGVSSTRRSVLYGHNHPSSCASRGVLYGAAQTQDLSGIFPRACKIPDQRRTISMLRLIRDDGWEEMGLLILSIIGMTGGYFFNPSSCAHHAEGVGSTRSSVLHDHNHPSSCARRSVLHGAAQTQDLGRHVRTAGKIPDQRRSMKSCRVASGMTVGG